MAQTYSIEAAGIDSVPVVKPNSVLGVGAKLRRYRATITLASQASGDTVVLADIPAGEDFAYGLLTATVSLGTATVAIGTSTTAGLYRAAAVNTAVDTPALFGTAAQIAAAPVAPTQRVILTVGTAALPASGTLVIDLFFTRP